MTDNFDWNQFLAISEDNSKETVSYNNTNDDISIDTLSKEIVNLESEIVVPNELRMLGYYNQPGQKMYPETEKVASANELCKLLSLSFKSRNDLSEPYNEIAKVYDTAVLIFKDRDANLYAFFPHGNIARLTNVVYNKKLICKTEGILKKWFKPGMNFFSTTSSNHTQDSNNDSQEVIYANKRSKIIKYSGTAFEFITPVFVKEIGWHAFDHCKTLRRVVISNGMNIVGDDAFYYCENLEDIDISDSVEYVGKFAFCGCHKLIKIKLPQHLKHIWSATFCECLSLASIVLPDSIEYIHCDAFENCPNLKSLTLPTNLKYIGDKAFQSCTSLRSMRFPSKLTKMEDKAFRYCRSLSEVWFLNGNIEIGDRAFLGCPIHTVHVSNQYEKTFSRLFPQAKIICDIDKL